MSVSKSLFLKHTLIHPPPPPPPPPNPREVCAENVHFLLLLSSFVVVVACLMLFLKYMKSFVFSVLFLVEFVDIYCYLDNNRGISIISLMWKQKRRCDPAFWNESDGYGATFSLWLTFEGSSSFFVFVFYLSFIAKFDCPVFSTSEIILIKHKQCLQISLKGVLNLHLLVAKSCMMKTSFANFSEWDVVVVATSNCYLKTSESMLIIFASQRILCSLLW